MGDHPSLHSAPTVPILEPDRLAPERAASISIPGAKKGFQAGINASFDVSRVLCACKRRWAQLYTDWWLCEFINLLMSLGFLLGIVKQLKILNHQTPANRQHSLKCNTILVLLAAASRACLVVPVNSSLCQLRWICYQRRRRLCDFQVMDSASRGVMGSLETIFRIRDPLAVLGALTIIAMLGLEPCTLQTISITPASNYVPTLLDFSITWITDGTYSAFLSKMFFEEDLAGVATAALENRNNFLFDPIQLFFFYEQDMLPLVRQGPGGGYSFACNQDKCLSPSYASLTLQPASRNITQMLQQECGMNSSSCSYSLPSGLSLNVSTQRMVMTATRFSPVNSTTPSNLLAEFELIAVTPYIPYSADGQPKKEDEFFAAAYHCQVSLCATAYQMQSYRNSTQLETPLRHTCKFVPISAESAIQLESPVGSIEPGSYVDNMTGEYWIDGEPNLRKLYLIDLNSHLTIDKATITWLQEFFMSMWTGSIPLHPDPAEAGYFQQSSGFKLWNILYFQAFEALYEYGKYPLFQDEFEWCFAYATETMSRRLRYSYGEPTWFDPVKADTPYYEVQWGWLALPISLFFATTVLLISVVVVSHMRQVPVWKASTLAILCHGINHDAHPELSGVREVSQMNTLARSHRFRLTPTPTGIRLVGARD